jgi:hypothetical protein
MEMGKLRACDTWSQRDVAQRVSQRAQESRRITGQSRAATESGAGFDGAGSKSERADPYEESCGESGREQTLAVVHDNDGTIVFS